MANVLAVRLGNLEASISFKNPLHSRQLLGAHYPTRHSVIPLRMQGASFSGWRT